MDQQVPSLQSIQPFQITMNQPLQITTTNTIPTLPEITKQSPTKDGPASKRRKTGIFLKSSLNAIIIFQSLFGFLY
jgi:hypothetical protein